MICVVITEFWYRICVFIYVCHVYWWCTIQDIFSLDADAACRSPPGDEEFIDSDETIPVLVHVHYSVLLL